MLTKEQAEALMDEHEVLLLLCNDEEMGRIEDCNPVLAGAYQELYRMVYGDRGRVPVRSKAHG